MCVSESVLLARSGMSAQGLLVRRLFLLAPGIRATVNVGHCGDGELFNGQRKAVRTKSECKTLFCEFRSSPIGGLNGIFKTRNALSSRFYWPGISTDIEKWVSECDQCQRVGKPLVIDAKLESIKSYRFGQKRQLSGLKLWWDHTNYMIHR